MNTFSFCNNTYNNAFYFSSVNDISDEIWQALGCTKNLYFNSNYLTALEKNNPQIGFSYIILVDDAKKPIALATVQIVDFYLESVQNGLQSMAEKIKYVGRKLRIIPSKKPLKILTCGNTFVSGEHGIFIKPNQDKKKVIKELAKSILHLVNTNEKLKKEISAFMLKDFIKESLFISDELLDYGYYSFNVEPNMVLNVAENWQSFNDYLAEMKTKFRVKAKKAMKQSADLQIEDVTAENIEELLPKMTSLYNTVADKAAFNLGSFDLKTYESLKENLGDNYILKAYCLGDTYSWFFIRNYQSKYIRCAFCWN